MLCVYIDVKLLSTELCAKYCIYLLFTALKKINVHKVLNMYSIWFLSLILRTAKLKRSLNFQSG